MGFRSSSSAIILRTPTTSSFYRSSSSRHRMVTYVKSVEVYVILPAPVDVRPYSLYADDLSYASCFFLSSLGRGEKLPLRISFSPRVSDGRSRCIFAALAVKVEASRGQSDTWHFCMRIFLFGDPCCPVCPLLISPRADSWTLTHGYSMMALPRN